MPKFTYKNNELVITYKFTEEHIRTLFLISTNDEGCAEFENREALKTDVDDLELRWDICDELVLMGLLDEDLEAASVYYDINDNGKDLVKQFYKTVQK